MNARQVSTEAVAVQRIRDAAARVQTAKQARSADSIVVARCMLRDAVQEATDDGMSWQSVGEVLGLRRGNAYQRFRRQSRDVRPSRRRNS